MVVAIGEEGGIGWKGALPWPRLSLDMSFFKLITTYPWCISPSGELDFSAKDPEMYQPNAAIMGRRTWESLHCKPLPNRINMVLTSQTPDIRPDPSVIYATGLEDALRHLGHLDRGLSPLPPKRHVLIIGGARLYQEGLMHAENVFITRLSRPTPLSAPLQYDTYFPDIPMDQYECRGNITPQILAFLSTWNGTGPTAKQVLASNLAHPDYILENGLCFSFYWYRRKPS